MAVKTFTSGEVLTASDTNTYLNNGGLVYVTSGTFANVLAVTVNSCFTSTYDNYMVEWEVSTASDVSYLYMQLTLSGTAATTNYAYGVHYTAWSSATDTYLNSGSTSSFLFGGYDAGVTRSAAQVTVYRPAEAVQAGFFTNSVGRQLSFYGGGRHGTNTAYDGFKIITTAGYMYGSYKVYGYRKA
jgi:hypothetical protein